MKTARRRICWYRTAGTVLAVFAFIRVAAPAEHESFEIRASWIRKVLNAVRMSTAAYDDNPTTYLQRNGFQVYGIFPNIVATEEETETSEAIDNTIVAKKNGKCYVAWRGADQDMREEWEQNFDFTAKTLANCQVHNGFDRNYSQRGQVDPAIHDCLASCGSSPHCPLVLTGHSQGGATAAIASLYWKDENPVVITFGAPRAIHSNCDSLQADNHYRFVTVITTTDSGWMQYDLVPMASTGGGRHYGHAFLLNDNAHLAYLGLNDDKTRLLTSVSVHSVDVYVERIEQLHSQLDTFPVYNTGWNNDEACGSDDECSSGQCAGAGIAGMLGGLC